MGISSRKKHKKSLKNKMIARTIIPTIVALILAGGLISVLTGTKVQELQNEDIENSSQQAAYQISEYFTKYMEATRHMAANNEMAQLCQTVQPGTSFRDAYLYDSILASIVNSYQTDTDNILSTWAVDVDSNQLMDSGGGVTEPGEWDINVRGWYLSYLAAENKDSVLSEPYIDSITGETVVTAVTPVMDQGSEIGFAGVDVSVQTVVDMMGKHTMGETGFYFLLTSDGTIMYAPDQSLVNTPLENAGFDSAVTDAVNQKSFGSLVYEYDGNVNYGYLTETGDSHWMILSGLPEAEYREVYYNVIQTTVILFLVIIVLLFLIIYMIARSITKPISRLDDAAERIAHGDLDVKLQVNSEDELGQLASSIEKTVVRLKDYIKYIDEISAVLNEIARGNLTIHLTQDYVGEFGKIKVALENISATLTSTVAGIDSAAAQVSSGALQLSNSSQALAQGATQQASAIEQLAATINEVSTGTQNSSRNGQHGLANSETAEKKLEECKQYMDEMLRAMDKISESSKEISKIIKTIEDIAFQTNILALNAAVEAARAGDVGKGFAVVADEVRNLASKSDQAAKATKELIEHSVSSVESGAQIVTQVSLALEESNAASAQVRDDMKDIVRDVEASANAFTQITEGIDQISSVVQTNTATSEQSAATSEELSAQAESLSELIGVFKLSKEEALSAHKQLPPER